MLEIKEYKNCGSEKYSLKFLFGVNILDLSTLIGVDAALKIFHFYGATSVYVPSMKSISQQIRNAQMRREAKKLKEDKIGSEKIFKHLAKKYKCSFRMAEHIINNPARSGKERIKAKQLQQYHISRDEDLLNLIQINNELFKMYRIIK